MVMVPLNHYGSNPRTATASKPTLARGILGFCLNTFQATKSFANLKTLVANVVKSLFAVLRKLSLKVLQCHRRQTTRFFCNFLAIFCAFRVSHGTC